MSNEEILTDDYVASLLAKDAKESSIKYSALGMEGFSKSKPPSNKPKPNTRFLRNIIKETDSHNAALLAKEAADSRARLHELAESDRKLQKPIRAGGDIRKRQLGDIAAILGGGPAKRKRVEEKRPERRKDITSPEDKFHRSEKDRSRHRKDRANNKDEEKSHRRERSTSRDRKKARERRKDERSRSRSPSGHQSRESRHRHRSPKARTSRSPHTTRESSHRSYRHRSSPDAKRTDSRKTASVKNVEAKPDYDSDPLDDIIGPRPPPEVRSRGRGTISGASGIDTRFSANYDPTIDVEVDIDEENDWDQALEALRDRQKWKQKGADRLREAGFTEDAIKSWENGGEKREEDVKWAKEGEGREWDRGKVINEDGQVSIDVNFGRLKDE